MPIAPGAYWDLLERNTPPVKRRATHSKARTGCVTCKRRRVKCDEAKPVCARCIKSGHRCAGYEDRKPTDPHPQPSHTRNSSSSSSRRRPDKSYTTTTTHHHLLLRPKPKSPAVVAPDGSDSSRSGECRVVNLLRASLTPTYLSARDTLYFERFKCQMIADLGAWCGSEYWRHTILREVLIDKTVQHAALGAAAMLMDIEQQCDDNSFSSQPRVEEVTGQESTVLEEQPSQTVVGIRNKRKEALPITSFSNTSPHGKAALGHYTAAISRCRQTLATEGVTSSTARSSLTATFFFSVFELVQGNVAEADQILSNGVSLLDHALSQANADGTPTLVPDNELREISLGFDRMQVTWGLCPYFGSDRDAYARTRESRIRHFELPSRDASVRTKQIFWNAFSSDFGQFMVSVQGRGARLSRGEDLSAVLAQRTKYLTQLRHWLPILEDLCTQDPESVILCTTKAYAQTAIIFLNCFLDPSDLAYDAYLPIFKDIVATYQRLLPSEAQKYLRLTLDVDLFHIITFTVSKCRDRETRALALQVFGEMTRQQALWTNAGMLTALRALVDLEDKGRDAAGFLPASSRYKYVDSEWDFQKRQMMAVFVPVLSASAQLDDILTIRIPITF